MSEFWPHQKVTDELYKRSARVLDLSDAGTGKTRVALEDFRRRRRNGGGRGLVIAPKTLLENAWTPEIRKFCPELTYSVAYARNREEAFQWDVDLYITNTDAARWLAQQPKSFFAEFDTLIIDEISDFKNKDSLRSKALKKIVPHFEHRSGLTATPTSNSIVDIWHQAYLIDDGHRLGKSFFQFRQAVQAQVPNPKFPRYSIWVDKENATAAVYALLKDISVRHDFASVMTHVPENQEYFVPYAPSKKVLEEYKKLKQEAMLQAENGDTVSAVNAAALRTKLLQYLSGAVYNEAGEYTVFDRSRYELIADLIEQRQHSVVFYSWRHQLDELVAECKKRKLSYVVIDADTKDRDRSKIVQQYQAGQYRVILMHPKTGAHGLTLTKGTSVIWPSPTDRADFLVQGKHRVYRGAQDKPTEAVMVCASNTLEKGVYKNTSEKRFNMEELLKLFRYEEEDI